MDNKKSGRPFGSNQIKKRYVVYKIENKMDKKIGKYKTFAEMALDLDLSRDKCQDIFYGRSKKLSKTYKIQKINK